MQGLSVDALDSVAFLDLCGLLGVVGQVLMRSCVGVRLTARATARILHGVGSPSFPAAVWARNPFWSRHAAVPFEDVRRVAHEELVANVM